MKLDKIAFANVVRYIAGLQPQYDIDLHQLDSMIDIDLPEQRVSEEAVQELMRQMNAPDGFIPAIKAYRVLTGAGLKEAKEAVEKFRTVKPA